ncbi:MAG TPA: PEGA domain-containing protein [Polyangiales bacterium]|nr:PEGA domain-containing protein [Polyangiales bacterium]
MVFERGAGLLLGLALCCTAAPLSAEPSAAERETARSLMDEADTLLRDGDVRAALERYRAADAIMHVPTTGLEVARTQARLRELVEAAAKALEVANSTVRADEPAVFTSARAEAQRLADELRARIPSLVVHVVPNDVGYELSVDGAVLPEAAHGLPFKLNPGTHEVRVEALGFEPQREQVELGESQTLERTLTLVPAVAATPSLVVAPPPAAKPAPLPLPAPDPGAAARTRGYIALTAGGAVFAAGVTTGILAAIASSDVKDQCSGRRCPPDLSDDIDDANTLANVANVTLAIGALALGYGVFELLNAESELQVTASGFGLGVRGAL